MERRDVSGNFGVQTNRPRWVGEHGETNRRKSEGMGLHVDFDGLTKGDFYNDIRRIRPLRASDSVL